MNIIYLFKPRKKLGPGITNATAGQIKTGVRLRAHARYRLAESRTGRMWSHHTRVRSFLFVNNFSFSCPTDTYHWYSSTSIGYSFALILSVSHSFCFTVPGRFCVVLQTKKCFTVPERFCLILQMRIV